jgi:hypothetical protein
MRAVLTLILCSLATATFAQTPPPNDSSSSQSTSKGTYTGVGKNGERVFSDQPVPGGTKVEMDPAQTYSSPPTSRQTSGPRPAAVVAPFRYRSCDVASPTRDETLVNPLKVTVTARVIPDLRPGDQIFIAVDGKQLTKGQASAILEPAFRGTHTASVSVRDSDGATICSSQSVFHVKQPTVNQGNRARQNTGVRRP